MKPLSLTMESFGSYLKKTEIDFTKITEPIFLITGDTGAGKSTIFDAIVFALYGKSSSANGKEGADFKSQYGEQKPVVTFKFIKNNKEYIVTRSLREVKKTKNGVRMVGTNTLLSLTLSDGTEFLGKVADIERKIEEIIGITKEQFTQVAMIAQGEFIALLRAKSDNKKEIFRKLFHTEKFAKLIDKIKEKRKEIKDEVEIAENLCKKDVSRIKIDDDEFLNLQNAIIHSKSINIVCLEQILEKAETHLTDGENKKDLLVKEVAALKQERDLLKENLTKDEELKKNFDLLKSAELNLNELLKDETTIKNNQKLSEDILKSYELKNTYDNFKNLEDKINLLKKNLANEETILPVLKKKLSECEKELIDAENSNKTENARLQEIIEKAKSNISIFDELEKLENELKKALSELKFEDERKKKTEEDREKLREETEIKKKELEAMKGIDARREKLNAEEKELAKFIDDGKELKNIEEALNKLRENLRISQKDYESKKAELNKLENEYKEKETLFFDSQAGILAKNLKDGEACPVCGSKNHPAPAKFDGKEIKKEELDSLSEKIKKARDAREFFAKAAEKNNTSFIEKEEQYKRKKEEIKAVVLNKNIELKEDITLEYFRNFCVNFQRSIADKKSVLQNDEIREKNAKEFIAKSEKTLVDLEKEKEVSDKKHLELSQKFSSLMGKKESAEKSKNYDDKKSAESALKDAKEKMNEAETNLKNLRMRRDIVKSKFEKSETLKTEYRENLPKEEKELIKVKNVYDMLKKKYDLSEEEWQNITNAHKREDSKILTEKVRNFDREKSRFMGSVATLKNRTEGKTYPNIDALKNTLAEKDKILGEKEEELSGFKENFAANKDAFESLKKEKKSREKILSLYQTYDNLANKLSSSAGGGYLDIETYAQRYYLSEILSYANKRLQKMTDGEYEMRTVSDKEANEIRSKGGLDLLVHSYTTGKDREVRTLSGGESFLTALALSLGMADSIEKRSVAISPDILFIDEGFGSLDTNARREAVKVLKSVAGKNRMIAVISHVSELKQEIDTKLQVKKGAEGSFIKWE